MQTEHHNLTDDLLQNAAVFALEDAFDTDGLPDAAEIDALLDLWEETNETAFPAEETQNRQKQQTLRVLRRKRRLSPRRVLAAAAVFAVLCTAAVLGFLQQSGRIDLPAFDVSGEPAQTAPLDVDTLLESLNAHAFENVALSQVFLEDGWVATAPTYYTEGEKRCADFRVYNAECCYCFNLKTGEATAEDYASLGAERVLTVEKEVVIYVFGNSADLSEMRYQVDDLTYNVTANVPAQTMIHTANQIENT